MNSFDPTATSHGTTATESNESLTPAMRTQDLSFYYGTQKALEGISLDIYSGQITAIIGPSGCGKSTFIKVLNRIGELEGKVKVDGKVEFLVRTSTTAASTPTACVAALAWCFKNPILLP